MCHDAYAIMQHMRVSPMHGFALVQQRFPRVQALGADSERDEEHPVFRLLIAVLALVVLSACSPAPPRDPAVVQDVLDYVAHIKKWEPVEAEVLKAMSDVRRSQYVDDDYVIATLGGVMDDVQLHLVEIDRYHPRTPAVAEVHERYRHAWHDLHDSFASIIHSMERKDYLQLSHGTESMERSRGELLTVAAALNALLEDSGLSDSNHGPASSS